MRPDPESPSTARIHRANRQYWELSSSRWETLRDQDRLWQRCPEEPELGFAGTTLERIREFASPLTGCKACILGSGDNYAAFALAGAGADVTSTDIAEAQLDVARRRADALNLKIRFLQADAADLSALEENAFDLVCSTNGLFVWIAEPLSVFREVARILRPGGYYIFYDIHPFQRPWEDRTEPLTMAKSYGDRGPYLSDEPTTYEFHWTVADLMNGLFSTGFRLRRIDESPADDSSFWEGHSYEPGKSPALLDWHRNPRAGLPVWLTVVAEKPESPGTP